MTLKDDGYAFFQPGQKLLEIVVIEKEKGTRDSIFQPTREDIREICHVHRFDFHKTMEMIEQKRPDVHTLMIDAEVYRKEYGICGHPLGHGDICKLPIGHHI